MEKNEIIIYQDDDEAVSLEVRLEDETVWLNRNQISLLFSRDVKTIGKHISNALKEELRDFSVVAKFATTASDGKKYQVEYYNLDMIISIGYRVKSQRGIQFRIWANKVLKEFLLKGNAIAHRIALIENKLIEHNQKIEVLIKSNLPSEEGIFYDGQVFDAWKFASDLIRSAARSIILIDNYVDYSVLHILSKRKIKVKASIYTKSISRQLENDLDRYNKQYPKIEINIFNRSHDRFIIMDELAVYHIGASLKDLGKKWFAFSKINIDVAEMLEKLV